MQGLAQSLILTIEDEETIRDSFTGFLEDLDYRVLEAADGQSGLAVFGDHLPDLVLLDLRMPGMDGLDVLVRIRQQAPDTPVIIISGAGRMEDVVEALRRGAHDFLIKPIEDLSILQHSVERCLERARLIRENRQYQSQLEEKIIDRTQDLATANQRLVASEEKYRLLFESMRHGFALCRPPESGDTRLGAHRLVEVNPAFVAMTGKSSVSLDNRPLATLFPGIDFKEAEQGGKGNGSHHLEYHDHSQSRYFDLFFYRRSNNDLVLMMADVTERRRLKEQLQQAQKMEAIGTLAGGIAHDFNNILGALMGYGELALLDLDTEHAARRKVENMLGSCHRAKDLVSRILSFSRQTQSAPDRVRVDLVVEEVLQLLRAALPTTIEIRKQIFCPGATVVADATQIHQVIMNLCTNAQHAMHDTGGVLIVAVECLHSDQMVSGHSLVMQPGDYVCLSVRDTGHGMDASTLQRAFDPYFTTKSKGEGTGFGLAVVHRLVKNWKGAIHVDSVPGKGTTFWVFFPRSAPAAEARPATPSAMRKGSGRIMMVDDEEPLVMVGQKMLQHAGYDVVIHTCPRKALEAFGQAPESFDLVITDMTMPKLTGDKLAARIHGMCPQTPVILCTGYREVAESVAAGESEFAKVLMKPLVMDDLLLAVGSALEDVGKGSR